MEFLTLGQARPEWRGFPDGYLMSYDAHNGMTLFFFLNRPPENVLNQIRTGHAFEIALADVDKVGFFTLRFGALPWGDCAFSPCLYAPPRPIPAPAPGGGVALNVAVIDSGPGTVAYLRTIRLGYEFSVKFSNWFANRMRAGTTPEEFRRIVAETYARYGTEQLRAMAGISWTM
ncbi:MAG: hypothetical protein IJ705_07285 [Oscillospiraceae bacterium]|nr:hypothetical protein [Oscillospiraceae bacterium]